MNKKVILIGLIVIVSFLLINKIGNSKQTTTKNQVQTQPVAKQDSNTENVSLAPADKIEVVNFFGTQRCASCLTIGEFTKKTLEKRFAEELKSGKIVFKEINGELSENKDIVMKYQARGSSLFINAIRGEQEDILEDVTVWRLVNSEEQFTTYLENKLNKLFGK